MVNDFVYKGRLPELEIAFSFAVTTGVANDAVLRHDCGPVSAHILGRALNAGLLSSTLLAEDERVNIRWHYDGNLKTLIVDAGADSTVRGFVSPRDLSSNSGDADDVFGEKGQITAVRSKEGQVLSHGTADAPMRHVAQDLAYFYSVSEQVETGITIMIGLQADVRCPVSLCRGLMIQALPECDLERFGAVRTQLEADPFRQLMARESEADSHFETIMNSLLADVAPETQMEFAASATPRFVCTCTRDKMGAVLRTLPYGERMSMAKAKEDVAVNCQFCSKRYVLTIDDCIKAWNEKPL
ncbi:MAG: Hsp33 family molecular chaperone HslO [Verrucomicrobia bacterium]|nr:Hsp33 family molecular chaperone HslO [Verrucomicrobiota bacterium]MDA1088080.1 Hsp33 family molecular chaperone HslO [Verrucomicrobiota bacterium]